MAYVPPHSRERLSLSSSGANAYASQLA